MQHVNLDIKANRQSAKWSKKEIAGRVIWGVISPLFYASPRILWGWRRLLLRAFGAKIGKEVNLYPSVIISIPWNITIGDYTAIGDRVILYALGKIVIGPRTTVSQGAHLCAGTHDYNHQNMPLIKSQIEIGAEAWICAEAFIGPDVTIYDRAIVGARAVVTKDVAGGVIVAGNPARIVNRRK